MRLSDSDQSDTFLIWVSLALPEGLTHFIVFYSGGSSGISGFYLILFVSFVPKHLFSSTLVPPWGSDHVTADQLSRKTNNLCRAISNHRSQNVKKSQIQLNAITIAFNSCPNTVLVF